MHLWRLQTLSILTYHERMDFFHLMDDREEHRARMRELPSSDPRYRYHHRCVQVISVDLRQLLRYVDRQLRQLDPNDSLATDINSF